MNTAKHKIHMQRRQQQAFSASATCSNLQAGSPSVPCLSIYCPLRLVTAICVPLCRSQFFLLQCPTCVYKFYEHLGTNSLPLQSVCTLPCPLKASLHLHLPTSCSKILLFISESPHVLEACQLLSPHRSIMDISPSATPYPVQLPNTSSKSSVTSLLKVLF